MSATVLKSEHEMEIALRLRPMLEAAEMFTPAYTPANVYFLAAEVRRDPVVMARAPKYQHVNPAFPALVTTDYVALLKAMTSAERTALHARIRAKVARGGAK